MSDGRCGDPRSRAPFGERIAIVVHPSSGLPERGGEQEETRVHEERPGAAGFRGLTRKTCQVGAMDWEKKKGQRSAYFFAAKCTLTLFLPWWPNKR